MDKNKLKTFFAFGAVYIIWGSTYLAIRYAVETIPPFLMMGSRSLLAGLVLFSLSVLKKLPN
jgi:drug/metabolite transporter (DMT)-like permease